MAASVQISANLKQVVPFLGVTDMERSVGFYIDGLGFTMKHQWVPEGKLRWCWLTRNPPLFFVGSLFIRANPRPISPL